MKRRGMTLLTVLTLVCALCATGAAGAETLAELRTETANGWQETLTDKNGTSVTVNAAIEIRDGVVLNPKILSFQGRSGEHPHHRV